MGLFRKKPVVIEAHRYATERDYDWLRDWTGAYLGLQNGNVVVRTLEGTMAVPLGHWVIKGVRGEFYSCSDDIFQATYEPAEPDFAEEA